MTFKQLRVSPARRARLSYNDWHLLNCPAEKPSDCDLGSSIQTKWTPLSYPASLVRLRHAPDTWKTWERHTCREVYEMEVPIVGSAD